MDGGTGIESEQQTTLLILHFRVLLSIFFWLKGLTVNHKEFWIILCSLSWTLVPLNTSALANDPEWRYQGYFSGLQVQPAFDMSIARYGKEAVTISRQSQDRATIRIQPDKSKSRRIQTIGLQFFKNELCSMITSEFIDGNEFETLRFYLDNRYGMHRLQFNASGMTFFWDRTIQIDILTASNSPLRNGLSNWSYEFTARIGWNATCRPS